MPVLDTGARGSLTTFAQRAIGDVAIVMRGRHTVKDWTPGEPRHLHIGNHGGTSEDEMLIPLLSANPATLAFGLMMLTLARRKAAVQG